MRRAAWLIGFLLVAPSIQAGDEDVAPFSALTSGDRVRFQFEKRGRSLKATIESVTADELVLRPNGAAAPLRFSLSQLPGLEVAQGRRSQWRKGALIGSIPGAVLFGLAGGVIECDIGDDDCFSPSSAVAGGLIGGALTASVGALVGLAFRTDRWVRVQERKPDVALMLRPAKGQAGLTLTVSF